MMICAIMHRHYFRSSHISFLVHLYTLSIKSLTHFSRKLEVKLCFTMFLFLLQKCNDHYLHQTPFTQYSQLSIRFDNHVDEQPLFIQPCWRNSRCSFNQLSNRVVQPVWQLAVYTIQPVVKTVVKQVWQPVECLYTRYSLLSNRFDNRLYRVNGASVITEKYI